MTELNYVATRNRLTGVVEVHTPFHIYDHPVLGAHLELIDPDEKPFVADLINVDAELARVNGGSFDDDDFEDEKLDDFDPPITDEDEDKD